MAATTTKAPPSVAPHFAEPAVWAILSYSGDPSDTTPPLAISADGIPPSGNPTLVRLPPSGGSDPAADALFMPSCLWVSSPMLPSGEAVRLCSYMTYGSATPIVLTATALNAALTLTAPDATNVGQVWTMVAEAANGPSAESGKKSKKKDETPDGESSSGGAEASNGGPAPAAPIVCQVENVGIPGAMRRMSTYAVPGTQLELGQGTDQDSHLRAYKYQFVRVG